MATPRFEQRVRDREDARIIRRVRDRAKAAQQDKKGKR